MKRKKPGILLLTVGFPVVIFGAYILMHIAIAAICVLGFTMFTQTREVAHN